MPTSLVHQPHRLLIALIVTVAALGLTSDVLAAACAQCNKTIGNRSIQSEGKTYCSRACYVASRPTCTICNEPLTGRFLRSEDKLYCSQACFTQTLPACEICGQRNEQFSTFRGHVYCRPHAEGPRCNECQLPFRDGFKLDDGRHLCNPCRTHAIFRMQDAKIWYDHARRELQSITGIHIPNPPPLELVDRHELANIMKDSLSIDDASVVRGCYLRTETVEVSGQRGQRDRRVSEVSEKILILFGQTRDNFSTTAVHELTHDLLADHFPELRKAPIWIEEGICQYIASIYCHKHGLKDTLLTIEESTHPVYGAGYQYFKNLLGPNNWTGLLQWLRNVDVKKLPRQAPPIKREEPSD